MQHLPDDLLVRYEAHRAEIGRRFFFGRDPGVIQSADVAGDRHLHGDAVLRVETEAGTLFYKPRDGACTEFLAELGRELFSEPMTPEQVSGTGYAFQKALTRTIPPEGAAREAYYRRLGRLCAVCYALGSIDMHKGNILAEGERCVVVDTETLLCARVPGFGGMGEFSADYGDVFPEYFASVGESMLLPRFYAFRQNTPILPGKHCRIQGYEDMFLEGFAEGYRRLVERHAFVRGLLERYSGMRIRCILRSTRSYGVILQEYVRAEDEPGREAALARLDAGLSPEELTRWQSVLNWERCCLREGDIPYFFLLAGETSLRGDTDGKILIPNFAEQSPIAHAKQRLARMNEADLAVQQAYIRGSLRHIDGFESPLSKYVPPIPKQPETWPAPLPLQVALEEVSEALHQLWEERISLSRGCVLWHVPLISGKVGCLFGLGEGFSGVAVFCDALAASSLLSPQDHAVARDLAAGCFRDLIAFGEYLLSNYPEPPKERVLCRRFGGGFGFSDGLNGLIWALERCKHQDPARAERILNGLKGWVSPGAPEEELLALLAPVDEPWSGTDSLENGVARRAARFLGKGQTEEAGRLLAWSVKRKRGKGAYTVLPPGRKQYFLPAFLRGSLGVAYVLLRYAESGCEKQIIPGGIPHA